jgi:antitoxin component YwqK of YwqJK toxin-antitoxin module
MLSFAQQERTLKLDNDKNLIEVTYFHDNGKVSQMGFYTKGGKLHGDWLSFDINGNKTVSAKYDNGKKVGKWFYWQGDQLKEVDYSSNAVASVNEWVQNKRLASND